MIIPVILAGQCANGNERDRGRVVHAVECSENHLGQVSFNAKALCGTTYGASSVGWGDRRDLSVNCQKCMKKMPTNTP